MDVVSRPVSDAALAELMRARVRRVAREEIAGSLRRLGQHGSGGSGGDSFDSVAARHRPGDDGCVATGSGGDDFGGNTWGRRQVGRPSPGPRPRPLEARVPLGRVEPRASLKGPLPVDNVSTL